jgi:hypothetical protein
MPFSSHLEDPDMDARDTNPCVFDPTAEYAAGYFRNTDPMLREPANVDAEAEVEPLSGEASPRVVFSSVFLLSGLGLGAFLLMYSWVHGAELRTASVTTEDVGIAAPQAESAVTATPFAPAPAAHPSETSSTPPAAEAVGTPAPPAVATLAPLPTVLLTEPAKAPAAARAPQTTTDRTEPSTADTAETNPYDGTPVATPPHPNVSAAPKAPVVIHVEPNPVQNPYGAAEDAKPSAPSVD